MMEKFMSYVVNDAPLKNTKPSLGAVTFVWFHRLIAVFCLMVGVGYNGGQSARFDLMPVHLQVAATSLAILLPVASVGLWMVVSWGPVIWVCAALIEIIMYVGFPELFGQKPMIVLSHLAIAFLYLTFRIVLYREVRAAAR
jgi:Family of unknown function (DUF6163)